ncbi:MAG: prepilin-type N-terminal cleavage/methylation domain-containing protein [Sandaracinaceae bacterium]
MLRRPFIAGFTLLEVMVAVAILALAMTAIFSSEAGAIRVGARARHMTTATLLARCKMAEIEEQAIIEGAYTGVQEDGEDECCEGGEYDGFRCEWNVERVELPDPGLGEDADLLGGLAGDHAGDTAGAGDIESALTGAAGGDAIGDLAMNAAMPVLQPLIEEQVRRVTVTVLWGEGESERSFDVSQFIVLPQGQSLDPNQATAPGQPPGQTGNQPPGTTNPRQP